MEVRGRLKVGEWAEIRNWYVNKGEGKAKRVEGG